MNVQFPVFLRPFFRKTIWRKSAASKVIYLTFDDGPVPEVTPLILDMLDNYGWKATFFNVGENVQRYPELYNEVKNRGHQTGNHTFNHLKAFNYPANDYIDNVRKAAGYIDSSLFRPPHGQITPKLIRELSKDYQIVMWDVITHDYDASLTDEQVLGNVTRNLRNGSIVVFHDSVKARNHVLNVLPKAIDFWISKGYTYGLL